MKFSQIQGNDGVKAAFSRMISSGRIPHAILLHEDDGGGAVSLALSFLQYLFCLNPSDGDSCSQCRNCTRISKMIHPDIHFIFPVGSSAQTSLEYLIPFREFVLKNPDFTEMELQDALGIKNAMIKVGEAKRLIDILSLSPLERGYRAIIVYLPEKMNAETANRLLKSIEEPPSKTQFLLITHAPQNVLQTISSRCQRIRIQPGSSSSDRVEDPVLSTLCDNLFDSLLGKDLLSALAVSDEIAALSSKEKVREFLTVASRRLRTFFLLSRPALSSLAGNPSEKERMQAAAVPSKFPRAALREFSRAALYADRNVSLKIVLSDLVNRLYSNL